LKFLRRVFGDRLEAVFDGARAASLTAVQMLHHHQAELGCQVEDLQAPEQDGASPGGCLQREAVELANQGTEIAGAAPDVPQGCAGVLELGTLPSVAARRRPGSGCRCRRRRLALECSVPRTRDRIPPG
jgi:hypothetical protein